MINILSIDKLFIILFIKFVNNSFPNYEDTREEGLKRLEYGRKSADKITGGRISFEYSDEQGVYCKANKDLYKYEFAFKIPKEYIMCSFDNFPYKFEIKQPLYIYLKNKYGKNKMEIQVRSHIYLMVFGMMFHNYENKTTIWEHLNKTNMDYYILDYSKQVYEFIEYLPKVIYSSISFGDDERKIEQLLGVVYDLTDEPKEILESTINYINSNHEQYKDYILPWINDYYAFNFFVNIVASRGFNTNINEYETLFDKKIISQPMGSRHYEIFNEINSTMTGTCFLPFADLCNHKISQDFKGRDKIDFLRVFKKGEVQFGLSKHFHKGENYEFSYLAFLPNGKSMKSYGFYIENNVQSITAMLIPVDKNVLNKVKYDYCSKLKLFFYSIEEEYNNPLYMKFQLKAMINKFELDKKMLTFLKIYMYPSNKFNEQFLNERLMNEQWISLDNELLALSYYRMALNMNLNQPDLKYIDILYSLHNTRKYFKENRENIINQPKLRYLYRLRRKIMQIGREAKEIYTRHLKMTQNQIKIVVSDQFRKFRNFISEI